MEGWELGERKNSCHKSSLLFIFVFSGERKLSIGLYSLNNLLIVSCTIASKTTNKCRPEDVLGFILASVSKFTLNPS